MILDLHCKNWDITLNPKKGHDSRSSLQEFPKMDHDSGSSLQGLLVIIPPTILSIFGLAERGPKTLGFRP